MHKRWSIVIQSGNWLESSLENWQSFAWAWNLLCLGQQEKKKKKRDRRKHHLSLFFHDITYLYRERHFGKIFYPAQDPLVGLFCSVHPSHSNVIFFFLLLCVLYISQFYFSIPTTILYILISVFLFFHTNFVRNLSSARLWTGLKKKVDSQIKEECISISLLLLIQTKAGYVFYSQQWRKKRQ